MHKIFFLFSTCELTRTRILADPDVKCCIKGRHVMHESPIWGGGWGVVGMLSSLEPRVIAHISPRNIPIWSLINPHNLRISEYYSRNDWHTSPLSLHWDRTYCSSVFLTIPSVPVFNFFIFFSQFFWLSLSRQMPVSPCVRLCPRPFSVSIVSINGWMDTTSCHQWMSASIFFLCCFTSVPDSFYSIPAILCSPRLCNVCHGRKTTLTKVLQTNAVNCNASLLLLILRVCTTKEACSNAPAHWGREGGITFLHAFFKRFAGGGLGDEG